MASSSVRGASGAYSSSSSNRVYSGESESESQSEPESGYSSGSDARPLCAQRAEKMLDKRISDIDLLNLSSVKAAPNLNVTGREAVKWLMECNPDHFAGAFGERMAQVQEAANQNFFWRNRAQTVVESVRPTPHRDPPQTCLQRLARCFWGYVCCMPTMYSSEVVEKAAALYVVAAVLQQANALAGGSRLVPGRSSSQCSSSSSSGSDGAYSLLADSAPSSLRRSVSLSARSATSARTGTSQESEFDPPISPLCLHFPRPHRPEPGVDYLARLDLDSPGAEPYRRAGLKLYWTRQMRGWLAQVAKGKLNLNLSLDWRCSPPFEVSAPMQPPPGVSIWFKALRGVAKCIRYLVVRDTSALE